MDTLIIKRQNYRKYDQVRNRMLKHNSENRMDLLTGKTVAQMTLEAEAKTSKKK
jgi:hypothetical protein